MNPEIKHQIIYLEDAFEFLKSLDESARKKVYFNIAKVSIGIQDKAIFKKLEGTDIWEFRTLYNGKQYRLLAFWDTETNSLIVATHGFVKKTQKTPSKEIDKAEKLKEEYFKNKHNGNK